MEEPIHILGLDGQELRQRLESLGLPGYRADQIRQWIFQRRTGDWAAMTNLSKSDRARLAESFVIAAGQVVTHLQADDGVQKLLLRWPDGASSETVCIPSEEVTNRSRGAGSDHPDRRTACISSQAGCPVGCRFCASGMDGLQRNLTAGEIVEQSLATQPPDRPAGRAIEQRGVHGHRRAAGQLRGGGRRDPADQRAGRDEHRRPQDHRLDRRPAGEIRKLADENLQVTLAISLHAPNQPLRAELVPWAAKFPLDQVLDAARDYFDRTGREITLEYVLLEGVNASLEHADELADLAHSLRCNVNLIYYNPVAELGFKRPAQTVATAFRDRLARRGVNVHIRASRGLTIEAACGQLRRRHEAGWSRE